MCYNSTEFLNSKSSIISICYTLFSISTILHGLGGYCILFKTPKRFRSATVPLFHFHFWGWLLDLTIGIVATPFFFIPTISYVLFGFGAVSYEITAYLVVLVFAAASYALIFLLENRHRSLYIPGKNLTNQNRQKIYRIIFYTFNIAYVITFPATFLLFTPDQKYGRSVAIAQLPCLAELNDEFFVFCVDSSGTTWILSTVVASLLIFLVQAIYLGAIVIRQTNFKEIKYASKRLVQLQRKFVISILFQHLIPAATLIPALMYLVISISINYHNQKLTNIMIFIMLLHGISACSTMLIVHQSYGQAILDLVLCRGLNNRSNGSKISKVYNKPKAKTTIF